MTHPTANPTRSGPGRTDRPEVAIALPGTGGGSRGAADEPLIILVDESDRPIGSMGKLAAHQDGGRLHRAFSVFIFNRNGEMLLQQRSMAKYHFGGLWTNACCSHPRTDQADDTAAAARERLKYEFGLEADLAEAFSFVYRALDPASGLTEHEFDHVFLGQFNGDPRPNPAEIQGWKWITPADLLADVRSRPQCYSPWFKIALDQVIESMSR